MTTKNDDPLSREDRSRIERTQEILEDDQRMTFSFLRALEDYERKERQRVSSRGGDNVADEPSRLAFIVTPLMVNHYNHMHRIYSYSMQGKVPDICTQTGGIVCANLGSLRDELAARAAGVNRSLGEKTFQTTMLPDVRIKFNDKQDHVIKSAFDILKSMNVRQPDLTCGVRDDYIQNVRAIQESLTGALEKSKERAAELQSRLDDALRKLQLCEKNMVSTDLETESDLRRRIDGLEQTIDEQKRELIESKVQCNILIQRESEKKSEFERYLKEQLNYITEKQAIVNDKLVEDAKKEVDEIKTNYARMYDKAIESLNEAERKDKEEAVVRRLEIISDLQNKRNGAEIARRDNVITELQNNITALEKNYGVLQERYEKALSKIQEHDSLTARYNEALNRLREMENMYKIEKENATLNYGKAESEIQSLRGQLDAASKSNQAKDEIMQNAEQTYQLTVSENSSLKDALFTTHQSNVTRNQNTESQFETILIEIIDKMMDDYNKLKKDFNLPHIEISLFRVNGIENLYNILLKYLSKIFEYFKSGYMDIITDNGDQFDKLQKDCEETINKLRSDRDQKANVIETHEDTISKLRSDRDEKANAIKICEDTINELRTDRDEKEDTVKRYKIELVALRGKYEETRDYAESYKINAERYVEEQEKHPIDTVMDILHGDSTVFEGVLNKVFDDPGTLKSTLQDSYYARLIDRATDHEANAANGSGIKLCHLVGYDVLTRDITNAEEDTSTTRVKREDPRLKEKDYFLTYFINQLGNIRIETNVNGKDIVYRNRLAVELFRRYYIPVMNKESFELSIEGPFANFNMAYNVDE